MLYCNKLCRLELPQVNGAPVIQTDPLTRLLVNDCGRHGRALKILAKVDIGKCNLKSLMGKTRERLLKLYQSAINWSRQEARALILAVLTHQLLDADFPSSKYDKISREICFGRANSICRERFWIFCVKLLD
jgi:hypothetical protein